MNNYSLEKIKAFAEINFCKPENEQVYADDPEFAVTNPWMDHSGRFNLTDDEAVAEWGLDTVLQFCERASAKMKELEDNPDLCGFIFRHGYKDYSVATLEMSSADKEAVQKILEKYVNDGCSVRNCFDQKISDLYQK